jgi:hypothetical protein
VVGLTAVGRGLLDLGVSVNIGAGLEAAITAIGESALNIA